MPCTSPAAARPDSMGRAGRLIVLLLTAGLAGILLLQACSTTVADVPWTSTVDTVTIYSLSNPDLTLPSAYNFEGRTRVHVEDTGQRSWDMALNTRAGQLVVEAPGALGITDSKARILALPGQPFAALQQAPSDTLLYSTTTPIPADLNTSYVVVTDLRANAVGTTCQYYAKMQPIALNTAVGSMQFIYDVSPVCFDRRLVPADSIK